MDKALTIHFKYTRGTKNTLRYDEIYDEHSQAPAVGQIYLQRSAALASFNAFPLYLTCTITQGE